MQPPLTYSWIALTASAPVVLLLTCWTLAVFHCRRRQWSTMDVFLVAILSQSIIQQFLGFIYSTLVLLKLSSPLTGDAVCTGMMWFFIAIPIFKGTTITSLAVDRWLFYTRFGYRLSIRKSHIRYHIATCLVLSCMVGFTALITFNNPELLITSNQNHLGSSSAASLYSFDQCTFLPFKFDLKFVIFYISVHCIIILIGSVILCKYSCHKSNPNKLMLPNKKHQYKRRRRSPPLDLTPTLSNTSTASSSISNSSPSAFFSTPGLTAKAVLQSSPPNNAFHQLRNQNPTRQSFHDQRNDETNYRLSSTLALVVLTIILTHLPFTIGTILSKMEILVPSFPHGFGVQEPLTFTNWPVTNIVLWCQVVEGLATLLVLLIVDSIVPSWIFNRGSSSEKRKLKAAIAQENYRAHMRLESNGNISTADTTELNNRNGTEHNHQYTNPGFSPDFKNNNKFPITNGSLFVGLPVVTPCNMRPSTAQLLNSASDDRFYHVLESHNPTPTPRHSRTGFHGITRHDFPEDDSEYDKKSYHHRYASVASVTTVANDDFEFHHSRPAILQRPSKNDEYNASTYVVPKMQHQHQQPPPPIAKKPVVAVEKARTSEFKMRTEARLHGRTSQQLPGTHPHQHPPTSLSMNDLDLIDDIDLPRNSQSTTAKTKTIPSLANTPTEQYEHKQRMYRKRQRLPANAPKATDRRNCHKSNEHLNELTPHRRVLSMECLSPSTPQTDYRNYLDISYLDTGDILVRKADSSKCIFVTDFI